MLITWFCYIGNTLARSQGGDGMAETRPTPISRLRHGKIFIDLAPSDSIQAHQFHFKPTSFNSSQPVLIHAHQFQFKLTSFNSSPPVSIYAQFLAL